MVVWQGLAGARVPWCYYYYYYYDQGATIGTTAYYQARCDYHGATTIPTMVLLPYHGATTTVLPMVRPSMVLRPWVLLPYHGAATITMVVLPLVCHTTRVPHGTIMVDRGAATTTIVLCQMDHVPWYSSITTNDTPVWYYERGTSRATISTCCHPSYWIIMLRLVRN